VKRWTVPEGSIAKDNFQEFLGAQRPDLSHRDLDAQIITNTKKLKEIGTKIDNL
jgi:hypothetical protein